MPRILEVVGMLMGMTIVMANHLSCGLIFCTSIGEYEAVPMFHSTKCLQLFALYVLLSEEGKQSDKTSSA